MTVTIEGDTRWTISGIRSNVSPGGAWCEAVDVGVAVTVFVTVRVAAQPAATRQTATSANSRVTTRAGAPRLAAENGR